MKARRDITSNPNVTHFAGDLETCPYYSPPNEEFRPKEITFGDMHGNTLKLIYLLIQQGVMQLPDDQGHTYNRLKKLYDKSSKNTCPLMTVEEVNEFEEILNQSSFNKDKLVRLIGDELADRGNNDYLTLLLMDKLAKEKVPFEVTLSNHSIIALRKFDNPLQNQVAVLLEGQELSSQSMWMMLNQKGFEAKKKNALEIAQTIYKPRVDLLRYHVSEDGNKVTLFTHAPVGLETIQLLAKEFGVTYNDESVKALTDCIDAINEKAYKDMVFKNTNAHFDALGKGSLENQKPVGRLIWSVALAENFNLKPKGDFTVEGVHGHIGENVLLEDKNHGLNDFTEGQLQERDPLFQPGLINLDNNLGKHASLTKGSFPIHTQHSTSNEEHCSKQVQARTRYSECYLLLEKIESTFKFLNSDEATKDLRERLYKSPMQLESLESIYTELQGFLGNIQLEPVLACYALIQEIKPILDKSNKYLDGQCQEISKARTNSAELKEIQDNLNSINTMVKSLDNILTQVGSYKVGVTDGSGWFVVPPDYIKKQRVELNKAILKPGGLEAIHQELSNINDSLKEGLDLLDKILINIERIYPDKEKSAALKKFIESQRSVIKNKFTECSDPTQLQSELIKLNTYFRTINKQTISSIGPDASIDDNLQKMMICCNGIATIHATTGRISTFPLYSVAFQTKQYAAMNDLLTINPAELSTLGRNLDNVNTQIERCGLNIIDIARKDQKDTFTNHIIATQRKAVFDVMEKGDDIQTVKTNLEKIENFLDKVNHCVSPNNPTTPLDESETNLRECKSEWKQCEELIENIEKLGFGPNDSEMQKFVKSCTGKKEANITNKEELVTIRKKLSEIYSSQQHIILILKNQLTALTDRDADKSAIDKSWSITDAIRQIPVEKRHFIGEMDSSKIPKDNPLILKVHKEMARHRAWWRIEKNPKDPYSKDVGAQTFKNFKKAIIKLKSESPPLQTTVIISPSKIEPG